MLQLKLAPRQQPLLVKANAAVFPSVSMPVNYSKLMRWLVLFAVIFPTVSFSLQCYHYLIDPSFIPMKKLNIDGENTYSAYFSMLILLFSSTLLLVIFYIHKRLSLSFQRHWLMLALAFFYLSADESIEIHEKFIPIVQKIFDRTDGIFIFAWVIPFGMLALVFAVSYLRFLARLPKRTARLMIASAALYLGGALGMEIVGSYTLELQGEGLLYEFCMTIEETLEMFGIVLFIYTLLEYIGYHWKTIGFQLPGK
jgi:hypothetical protein